MSIISYTKDHLLFRDRIRKFCQEKISPQVDLWEANGIVPREIWKEMGKKGFLCTWASPQYGGMGGDFLYSVIALEEMARTNQYGLDAFLHSDIVAPYIAAYGTDAQKETYLPGCISGDTILAVAMTEPGAGSDLASMSMTGEEKGDTAVLNGTKTFISNGILCDLVVVAACDPLVDDRRRAVSLYLVENGTPGFTKGKTMKKLGVHSQDTSELFFSNCRIPLENRLGPKGAGFGILMEKLQQERLLVATLAVCMAEFILEWTLSHLKGDGMPPLSESALFSLAEHATEVNIGRVFVDSLVAEHMGQKDVMVKTCMAKYWASDMANQVASGCLELMGSQGMTENCPIVRTFRDLRVFKLFAGTNEIMKLVVSRSL